MTEIDSKTCTACGEAKPLAEFYPHRSTRDRLCPECKPCVRARVKAHRIANPAVAERDRKRYAENEARREANKRSARESYARNREARKAVVRAYFKANPEVRERAYAKRRARLWAVDHEPYTRREIYDRDEGVCKGCGVNLPYKPRAFHIDHVVPISLGGPDTPANVQLLCEPCNREKWARTDWVPPRPALF